MRSGPRDAFHGTSDTQNFYLLYLCRDTIHLGRPPVPISAALCHSRKNAQVGIFRDFWKNISPICRQPRQRNLIGTPLRRIVKCMRPSGPPPHSVEGLPSPPRPGSPFIGGGSRTPAIYSTLAALPAGRRSAFSLVGML